MAKNIPILAENVRNEFSQVTEFSLLRHSYFI